MSKVRCLVAFSAELADLLNSGSGIGLYRWIACDRLARMYDIVLESFWRLIAEQFEDLEKCTDEFLQAYATLSNHYDNEQKLLWNFTFKHHWLWHLVDESRFLNPRLTWTFGGEDFVGDVANLGKGCLRSGTHLKMMGVLMDRYTRGVAVRRQRSVGSIVVNRGR